MSIKYWFLVVSLFISVPSYAQLQGQKAIDSMVTDLNAGHYLEDTNKVKQLIRICWGYDDLANTNESKKFALQAYNLSAKLNYKKGMSLAYAAIGRCYAHLADSVTALSYFNKSLKLCEELGDKTGIAVVIANIGELYFHTGNYKIALTNYLQALKINEETGNKYNIAISLNWIGNIYIEEGYYPKSLEYQIKALNIYEQLGKKTEVASSFLNIANIFSLEGNYEKAIENYNKSININQEIGNNYGIASCYCNIGDVYLQQGELSLSMEFFHKALKVKLETENKDLVEKITTNIGRNYYKQKKYSTAIAYFEVSIKLCQEINQIKDLGDIFNSLGECYLGLANSGTSEKAPAGHLMPEAEIKQYISKIYLPTDKISLLRVAFIQYLKGLAIGRDINAQSIREDSYEGIATVYKLNKDYKKALEYADSARAIKDSVFAVGSNFKILQMEMKNENERQHLTDSLARLQDNQAKDFKLQKQNLMFFTLLGIFIAIVTSTILFQRFKVAKTRSEQEAIFSKKLIELELIALRAQMNPHFIFNCLNSIQAFILKENKEDAADYLQKFSKLIRMILDMSSKTSNTIVEEVEILALYIDMEKLRLKNKFDYEIKMSGEIDPTFTEIPSMALQPIVENSIWHGLSNSSEKGILKIEFLKEKYKLVCIIEDNGIGRDKSKILKSGNSNTHESKGQKLVESRLEAWIKEKGFKYTYEIFDNIQQDSGTRTVITILYPPYA